MFYTDRLGHVFRLSSRLFEGAPDLMSRFWAQFTRRNPVSYFLTSRFGFNPATAVDEDILGYMEGVQRTPMKVFHSLLKDYTEFDGRDMLRDLAGPVLVVAGTHDFITPISVQEELARLLPRGEMERVPYGSHNAHMDYPDRVNYRIAEFLKKIEYR
jgi:pimeloyl-ACP methyl ester carboxylesterase